MACGRVTWGLRGSKVRMSLAGSTPRQRLQARMSDTMCEQQQYDVCLQNPKEF